MGGDSGKQLPTRLKDQMCFSQCLPKASEHLWSPLEAAWLLRRELGSGWSSQKT